MANPGTGVEELIIREVSSGSPITATFVDATGYLHFGEGPVSLGGSPSTTTGSMLNQRATANIALIVRAGDTFQPQVGWQVFYYDLSNGVQYTIFAGTIDNVVTSWYGHLGDRLVVLSCVSFEQTFDTVRAPGILYQNQTAGYIVTQLLGLVTGWPGTNGIINAGATIANFLISGQPTISSLFDKLAQLSDYIWWVDPQTLEFNFAAPGSVAAPFTLEATDVLAMAFDFKSDRHDFRDRQYVSIDFAQFGGSSEVFVGDGVSTSFTLRNPVDSVTAAFITRNTQNTAIGTLSGLPSPGDTVSIGFPTSGSIFNWAPNSPYQVGYTIIDHENYIQKVTSVSGISPSGSSFGQSGNTEPTWNETLSGLTYDDGLVWTNQGSLGLGPSLAAIYTFVLALDNTVYGQVLIDPMGSVDQTLQNLVDAINSTTSVRGITYSLPTWENILCNAEGTSGSSFTIANKTPGQGYIASLAYTGTAFSWSASLTSGGITTFNTISLSVGTNSPDARTTSLSYTPGLAVVGLPSPLNTGTNLQVVYNRIDGNIIGVENTALVSQRAEIEGSIGKYQALFADVAGATPVQALTDANAALTAFETIPSWFEFQTYRPGLRVGMSLLVGFSEPYGPLFINAGAITGGTLYVNAEYDLISGGPSGAGTLRVNVSLVNSGFSIGSPAAGSPVNGVTTPFGQTTFSLSVTNTQIADIIAGTLIVVGYFYGSQTGGFTCNAILKIYEVWLEVNYADGSTVSQRPNANNTANAGTVPGAWIDGSNAYDDNFVSYASIQATTFGTDDWTQIIGFAGWQSVNAWVIQETETELEPSGRPLTPLAGTNRYTHRCIDQAQLGSFLQFWENLGGGSGGISSTATFPGNTSSTTGGSPSQPSSATPTASVLEKTSSYATTSSDSGSLITFSSSSGVTLTLPSTAPGVPWVIDVENTGTGALTINPNGLDIDGSSSSLTLTQNQGIRIFSDGANYFTQRGLLGGQPYDMWMYFPSTYTASQKLFEGTFPRAVTFPANMSGSYGSVVTNPTSTATVTIVIGSTTITVSISTGGTVTFSSSAVTTAAGTTIVATSQASPDATLAGLSLTLVGAR